MASRATPIVNSTLMIGAPLGECCEVALFRRGIEAAGILSFPETIVAGFQDRAS